MSEVLDFDKLDVVGEDSETPDNKFSIEDIEAIIDKGNKDLLEQNFEKAETDMKQKLSEGLLESISSEIDINDEAEIYALQILGRLNSSGGKEFVIDGQYNRQVEELVRQLNEKNIKPISIVSEESTNDGVENSEGIENSEILKKFGIDKEEFQKIEKRLSSLGLESDLGSILSEYDNYIENELGGLDSSILEKIKQSIGLRLNNIIEVVDGFKETSNEEGINFEKYRWEVNSQIQELLEPVNTEILPSAYFLLQYENSDNKEEFKEKALQDIDRRIGNGRSSLPAEEHFDKTLEEVKEMFNAELNQRGEFDEGFFSHQNILNIESNHEKEGEIASNIGIDTEKIPKADFLSERDKEIQKEAMTYYMIAVGIQMCPYAGAVASVPVDTREVSTDKEATMAWLKDMDIVPDEYHMSKSYLDYIFGALGIAGAAFGLQALVKSGKLASAVNKVNDLGKIDVGERVKDLGNKMGVNFDDDTVENIENWMGFENEDISSSSHKAEKLDGGNNLDNSSNIDNGEGNKKLYTEDEIKENSKWVEKGNLGFPNEILRENGLDELSDKQLKVVKELHDNVSNGLWQNSLADLLKMSRLLKKEDLNDKQIRVLMESGILGKEVEKFRFSDEQVEAIKINKEIFGTVERQAYISGMASQFLLKDYNMKPGDVDVAVTPENMDKFIDNIYKGLVEKKDYNGNTISTVEFKHLIKGEKPEDLNPDNFDKEKFKEKLKEIANKGELAISYKVHNFGSSEGTEVEIFPEKDGKGITNLDYINDSEYDVESYKIKDQKDFDGKELEVPVLKEEGVAKGYVLNYLNEFVSNYKDEIEAKLNDINNGKIGLKDLKSNEIRVKDANRINNIYYLLKQSRGDFELMSENDNVDDLEKFIRQTVGEYNKLTEKGPPVEKAINNVENGIEHLNSILVKFDRFLEHFDKGQSLENKEKTDLKEYVDLLNKQKQNIYKLYYQHKSIDKSEEFSKIIEKELNEMKNTNNLILRDIDDKEDIGYYYKYEVTKQFIKIVRDNLYNNK